MKLFAHRSLQIIVHHLTSWQQAMRNHSILEVARNRALVIGGAFFLAFIIISLRLSEVMIFRSTPGSLQVAGKNQSENTATSRADIIDRNGEILATHLITGSVYANPKVVIGAEEAALKLSELIPGVDYETILRKLKSDKGFIWLVRHIPPKLQSEVNKLGIPGVYLQKDEKRLYPFGNLVSHVLGYCGIDNIGLAGVEKYFDSRLRQNKEVLQLSIDVRVQHVIHDELSQAISYFQAEGGNAMLIDIQTGELLAMVSLPDYDPNLPNQNPVEATFNRNTLGLYESGSIFKIFNTAIALEKGIKLTSLYDTSSPIKVGSKQIKDFKGKNRVLDVREVFIYSSNIGSAKMALDFGREAQRQYLGRFGMLMPPQIELPEVGTPLVPKTWRDVTTMTIAYGYGLAVSPLQSLVGALSVIRGVMTPATLLKVQKDRIEEDPVRILSEKTSQQIRDLMRLVVTEGTAKSANVPGYDVFGKTGTAHKNKGRAGYNTARLTSFIGGFPKNNPQYMLILFLDDPKPTKETYGYATGGWTSAPTAGKIIARVAPLLGVALNDENRLDNEISKNVLPIQHLVDR